ncbi:MAG: molybdopterin-dependent oxidoreductase [Dehalococcoidia bacterium]|nr:molybdopterin-dependent oxidoreductase [Dehalococcoidia bacterium]
MERPRGELERLPGHPVPTLDQTPATWRLSVDGLGAAPCSLSLADLRAFGERPLTADFACEEGWVVRDLRWAGVALAAVVARARPLPAARFVAVAGSGFTAVLPLAELDALQATLALELDGAPIPVEHGGPLRLVLVGGACYQGVKWVQRLTLTADESLETARPIALTRIGRSPD